MRTKSRNIFLPISLDREIMSEAELVVVTLMQSSHVLCFFLRQLKTRNECIQDRICRFVQLPVEAGRKATEPGKNVFRQPDVVLKFVLVTSNLVALLVHFVSFQA